MKGKEEEAVAASYQYCLQYHPYVEGIFIRRQRQACLVTEK